MKVPLLAILIGATMIAGAPPDPPRVPVLLELFTSEGCSSCPPADLLLESLDRQPLAGADLIVVSEHVDYWNYLGWSDPYSSALFSARQQKYSNRMATDVYTPQLVIDGQVQVTGSDRPAVMRAIAQVTQQTKLSLSVHARSGSPGHIHVETGGVQAGGPGADADLYIIVAADRARSQVLRGENGGHVLTHVAVAQSITKIGKWNAAGRTGQDVPIGAAHAGATRVIAVLADRLTGRILGVAQTRI